MANTMKIPIPTNTREAGYIDQEVSYLGDEKRDSIKWSINSLFSHHSKYWREGRFVSPNFNITSIDGSTLTWCLALVKSQDLDGYFYLFPCFLPENECKEVFVKIELSVLDESRTNKQWIFSIGEICTFDARDKSSPVYLRFNARKYVYRRNINVEDTLVVVCDITRSNLRKSSLSKDLEHAFRSQDFTDIALFSKDGKIFKTHKMMLAARSSVFAAMFTHKMKENEQHEVKIADMDGEVMEEMLRYMYTGKTENLKLLAKDLLMAAEKYDLKELKTMCEDVFISDLSVSNAVEMLQFSDLRNAGRLKSAAIDFLIEKDVEVMNTEAWKSLEQSSFHLVKAVCEAIVSRSKNVK